MLFSRESVIEVLPLFERMSHAEIDRFALRFGLEGIALDDTVPKYKRANAIALYLINNPDLKWPSGENVTFKVIEFLLGVAQQRNVSLEVDLLGFKHSLKRDGYMIEQYVLKRTLPEHSNLPEKETELNTLLHRFRFNVSKGHLEQAINAHTRGDWAASNAQMRTFVESFFDAIAEKLGYVANPNRQDNSQHRREYLAKLPQPFLLPGLNEWEIGGKGGFVQGFWRRLNPEGSHPGLSDEDDSTFRLQLVVIVAHHLLKRLCDHVDF